MKSLPNLVEHWHTRQHMPERLGIPGFLSKPAVNWQLTNQRWFTLYETRTLEVLGSDDYRVRLNNPSRWSNRMQPVFRISRDLRASFWRPPDAASVERLRPQAELPGRQHHHI